MLYKFKSPASGDLVMLEANGRRVLEIIGKQTGPTGIILPEQMAGAIQALEAAVALEDAQSAAADGHQTLSANPTEPAVGLRTRVWPFVEMLRRCQAANKEIVWGV